MYHYQADDGFPNFFACNAVQNREKKEDHVSIIKLPSSSNSLSSGSARLNLITPEFSDRNMSSGKNMACWR
jgi:hypothetical protein